MVRIILITLLLFISCCRWLENASTPYTIGAGFKVPPGTPAFQQGYRDGCSQIFYSRGNSFYRWRHKYQYNPKMNGNSEYRFGYKRGGSFCFNFITPGVTAPDRYIFPNKDPILAMDYNKTGFFEGPLDAFIPQAEWGGLDGVYKVWSGSGGDSVFGANPLWAGGSSGQFFGQ